MGERHFFVGDKGFEFVLGIGAMDYLDLNEEVPSRSKTRLGRLRGGAGDDDVLIFGGGIVCCIVVLVGLGSFITIIPPGMVGVRSTFGSVNAEPLHSGLHLVNPLSTVNQFSVATTKYEEWQDVPTAEGLNVDLDVAILYHIEAQDAVRVLTEVGYNFETVLIKPDLASAARDITARVPAEALYDWRRTQIQAQLKKNLNDALAPRGIQIEAALLKSVRLPPVVKRSIESKVKAQQDAERMVFVLQKEQQEAKRKTIEATGISAFQQEVSKGISAQLLQWKGIEATEEFANSPNSRLVLMGSSKQQMPVILGDDKNNVQTAPVQT